MSAASAVYLGLLVAFYSPLTSPPHWWAFIVAPAAAVLAGAYAQIAIVREYPSLRRIGISPTTLILDSGVGGRSYSWADLQEVARTQVVVHSKSQVQFVRRTCISVWQGLRPVQIALSQNQGDRLASFLRLP
jgi:hypothetical protein